MKSADELLQDIRKLPESDQGWIAARILNIGGPLDSGEENGFVFHYNALFDLVDWWLEKLGQGPD